ncbi:MAG: S-methyl-5'-thioadenosine phosphorylase [Kofleriaceae bacterium]
MAGVIGIVGGTGIYDLDGLVEQQWRTVESPFGKPSDQLLFGRLGDQRCVFLPRHGRGHKIPPHEINFAANIDALKRAGVTTVISLSAVGSLKPELAPGTFVIVDQFIDRTLRTPKTFFSTGFVAHVSMAHPTCKRVMAAVESAGTSLALPVVRNGTYVCMEGPQFSSLAESTFHRGLGASVIGMTNMPEAKLAREAELCYATVAMVTDFDCWHPDHDHVKVEDVVKHLLANSDKARKLVAGAIPLLGAHTGTCEFGCDRALDNAILTAESARDPELCKKLEAIAGRVIGKAS